MDLDAIMALISNVGFPICMCLILCWYLEHMTELHKSETDGLRNSLDNNTKVLTEIGKIIELCMGDGNVKKGN